MKSSQYLTIRITDELKKMLEIKAKLAKKTMSRWIRDKIKEES
jgi:predicted HicB family RNase H-like nuclease